MSQESSGCLFAIFRLLGIGGSQQKLPASLPYLLRDDFLSPAEVSFLRVLQVAVKDSATIFTKINLADLFFVPRSEASHTYRNKIDRKHLDFLLCHPDTMKPLLGIELDDRSHERPDRIERDQFVNAVFSSAGLPLLHVPVKRAYNVAELSSAIALYIKQTAKPAIPTPVIASTGTPICPKCRTPMLQRTASKGENKGNLFWGCANYPKCRETK